MSLASFIFQSILFIPVRARSKRTTEIAPYSAKGLGGYTTRTKTPNQRTTTTTTRLIKKETKSPSALTKHCPKGKAKLLFFSLFFLIAGCFVTVFLQYKHKHAHLELLVATSLTEGSVVSQGSSGEREPCPENLVFARAIFQGKQEPGKGKASNAVKQRRPPLLLCHSRCRVLSQRSGGTHRQC
jgi:hypothetical protein